MADWRIWLSLCALLAMVVLRTYALESDPYPRLSWSSGLLTDEGYYIHNARNLVLFGVERTDDFNNMVIMPTLHIVQVAVFRLFGAGAVPARMISVICSLLTIGALFAACRRAFGLRVAAVAALFLGMDHINLLYNRMALMDTPGVMLLVFALYAWVRGTAAKHSVRRCRLWLTACGALLGAAIVTRGLAGLAIPAVFLAAWLSVRAPHRSTAPPGVTTKEPSKGASWRALSVPIAVGLAAVLLLYFGFWYAPYRDELVRMNRYYVWHQLTPKTAQRLLLNSENAWFGDERGAAPFLMRHSPVLMLLTIDCLITQWLRAGDRSRAGRVDVADGLDSRYTGPAALFLLCWLGCSALFLSVANYTPSRYFLLFYPALAVVAAFSVVNARAVVEAIVASKGGICLLGMYAAYHAALVTWHHAELRSVVAVGIATAVGGGIALVCSSALRSRPDRLSLLCQVAPVVMLIGWSSVNIYYLGDWITHLTFEQRDASRWLADNLPQETVLIGDVAPGLCLYNGFEAVSVIPGLCNDNAPLARFAARPRAIVVLDGPTIERWWIDHYPDQITTANRIKLFPHIGPFTVGVYKVRGL